MAEDIPAKDEFDRRVQAANDAAEELPSNADRAQVEATLACAEMMSLQYDQLVQIAYQLEQLVTATGATFAADGDRSQGGARAKE